MVLDVFVGFSMQKLNQETCNKKFFIKPPIAHSNRISLSTEEYGQRHKRQTNAYMQFKHKSKLQLARLQTRNGLIRHIREKSYLYTGHQDIRCNPVVRAL